MDTRSALGQHRYLFGLRQELVDLTSELGRHTHRLRWPDGYLTRETLAGKRCTLAHEALARSTSAMGAAAREYDGMLADILNQGRSTLRASHTHDAALLLLGKSDTAQLHRLRTECQEAMRAAGDVLAPGARQWNTIDCTWPIWRSELPAGDDPYRGEVRPMAWTGFGDQPLIHVDAR